MVRPPGSDYPYGMELVALALIGLVAIAVAVDAVRRDRRGLPPAPPRDPAQITTQKIIVDLSRRH